jgi:hypothetical protein
MAIEEENLRKVQLALCSDYVSMQEIIRRTKLCHITAIRYVRHLVSEGKAETMQAHPGRTAQRKYRMKPTEGL